MDSFFSDFLSGGGFPGGHHRHHAHEPEDEEPIDTEKYYEILGIEKDATEQEVKKAYRKKARELHPDRHPDERERYQALFQEVQQANEILKDAKKRSIYDKYGAKAAQRGGAPQSGSAFEQLFRQSHGQTETHGQKKSPLIKKIMDVTLEDLYRGSTKSIEITRFTSDGDSQQCAKCHGSGVITVVQRLGPMMLQQRAECNKCDGNGYQLATEDVEIEVHIPIGARHAEKFTVMNEGNQYPEHSPGDVEVQFRQMKHKMYKRQGADLGMNYTLSLRQALCGYRIRLKHVSLKTLIITPKNPLEVVQPGSLKRIYTLGMPQRFGPHVKGHLYIVMEVEMPLSKSLSPMAVQKFAQLLPNTKCDNDFGDDDDTDMKDSPSNSNSAHNSDDNTDNTNETNGNASNSASATDAGANNASSNASNNTTTNNNNNTNNTSKKNKRNKNKNKNKKQNNRKQNRNNKRNSKNRKNNKRNNNNNNKSNSMKDMFGGLYDANNKQKNNNNTTKPQTENNNNNTANAENNNGGEEEFDEMMEEVECSNVDDNPKATPSSARHIHDEDEDGDGVQCRQM